MTENMIRTLASEEPPPSSVDVDRLVRAGRARVRTRRWAAVSAAGVAVAFVIGGASAALRPDGASYVQPAAVPSSGAPGSPSATPSAEKRVAPQRAAPRSIRCTIQQLPLAPRALGDASGQYIDSTGRYVAGLALPSLRPVLWVDGAVRPLPEFPGPVSSVDGVNSSGVVIGTTERNRWVESWMYANGRYHMLAKPAGSNGVGAVAINDRGEITGSAVYGGGPDGRTKPVRWRVSDPDTVELLASPADVQWSAPVSIGQDGTIGGTNEGPGSNHSRPIVWHPDGSTSTPPALSEEYGKVMGLEGDYAWGTSGVSWSGDGPAWVLWNLRARTVEEFGGFLPTAVAADGTVLGRLEGTDDALWRSGALFTLPRLRANTGVEGADITPDGKTVLGTSGDTTIIWRC